METKLRSIFKTITWRVVATIITGITVFVYTGKFKESSEITMTAAAILTVGYYIHERLWVEIRK